MSVPAHLVTEAVHHFIHEAAKVPIGQRWHDWTPPAPFSKGKDEASKYVFLCQLNDGTSFPVGTIEMSGVLRIGYPLWTKGIKLVVLQNQVFENLDLRKIHFMRVDFTYSSFDGSTFDSMQAYPNRWTGFESCYFAGTSFVGANLHRLLILDAEDNRRANTSGGGLIFEGAHLRSVWFRTDFKNPSTMSTRFDSSSNLHNVVYSGNWSLAEGIQEAQCHHVVCFDMDAPLIAMYFAPKGEPKHNQTPVWPKSNQIECNDLMTLAFGTDPARVNDELCYYCLLEPGFNTWKLICANSCVNSDLALEVAKAVWTLGIH